MDNTKLNNNVRDQRKKAVLNTFFDTMKQIKTIKPWFTIDEVIQKAVEKQAPRFFVTFENARRFISLMARGKKLPFVNENKIEMYRELYRRYIKRDPGGRYQYLVLEDIIEEPAPSFYLDVETFRGIVYKTLHK